LHIDLSTFSSWGMGENWNEFHLVINTDWFSDRDFTKTCVGCVDHSKEGCFETD